MILKIAGRFVVPQIIIPEKHHQNLYFLQLQNLSSGYILCGNIAVIGKVDQSFKSVPGRELQRGWNSAVIKHNRIKFIPLFKISYLSEEGTAPFCSI